jgi:hypothetical protein
MAAGCTSTGAGAETLGIGPATTAAGGVVGTDEDETLGIGPATTAAGGVVGTDEEDEELMRGGAGVIAGRD